MVVPYRDTPLLIEKPCPHRCIAEQHLMPWSNFSSVFLKVPTRHQAKPSVITSKTPTSEFILTMASSGLINIFRNFPKELFRVNNGRQVKLRVQQPGRHVYDILAKNGQVEPKALNPSTYIGKSDYLSQHNNDATFDQTDMLLDT